MNEETNRWYVCIRVQQTLLWTYLSTYVRMDTTSHADTTIVRYGTDSWQLHIDMK